MAQGLLPYMYIYIYIHVYIHTYIHTYARMDTSGTWNGPGHVVQRTTGADILKSNS